MDLSGAALFLKRKCPSFVLVLATNLLSCVDSFDFVLKIYLLKFSLIEIQLNYLLSINTNSIRNILSSTVYSEKASEAIITEVDRSMYCILLFSPDHKDLWFRLFLATVSNLSSKPEISKSYL